MTDRLLTRLRALNRVVAVLIGIMLLACAGFVLLDIVLRQVGSSFGGTDEVSGYVMAIATSWGMAYAMLELGHVRIDILRSRAAGRGRSLFDLASLMIMAGTVSVIALRCWPVVDRSISNMSRANTALETPLWLVQLPWFAGWVWFALMAWLTFVTALFMVLQGRFDASEAAIGVFAEEEAFQ